MRLLAPGGCVPLQGPDGSSRPVTVEHVEQRAWSRVGVGADHDGSKLFVKQFVTRSGSLRPALLTAEASGAEVAEGLFRELEVLRPCAFGLDDLVLAYPWRPLTPLDELVRTDPVAFAQRLPDVLRACSAEIQRCRASADAKQATLTSKLTSKRSADAVLGVGTVFKAFELRNLAVAADTGGVVAFDLGQPRLGPVEEAGARAFISAALLNWGVPLRRFLRGPDEDVLRVAWHELATVTTAQACARELDYQFRSRSQDHAWTYRGAARLSRRAVIRAVGGRYVRRVNAFVSER